MKICVSCKKEMRCKKNGVTAVWGANHAYAGDLFACEDCGNEVLICNSNSHQVTELGKQALESQGCLLEMPL